MTCDDALRKFGLTPAPASLEEIRRELIQEMNWRKSENDDEEDDHFFLFQLLCVQLFAAGHVEDSLNIWRAKQNDFDAFCFIDSEFLCGAGVEATQQYLYKVGTEEANKALEYILDLDWDNFTPEKHLAGYTRYFGQSDVSSEP